MSPSEQSNRATREEWRELGFYYDFDEMTARWRLIGSRSGLLHFRNALLAYATDPKRDRLAEHDHIGPYFYFSIRTWKEPAITRDGIMGTLADLQRFARLFEEKLQETSIGGVFTIGTEYAIKTTTVLQCDLQADGFDPASADPLL